MNTSWTLLDAGKHPTVGTNDVIRNRPQLQAQL